MISAKRVVWKALIRPFSIPTYIGLLSAFLTLAPVTAKGYGSYQFNKSAEASTEVEQDRSQRTDFLMPTSSEVKSTIAYLMQSLKSVLDPRTTAQGCLALAVYFEARSESELGQLAVATVILNRTKASNYPSSICGVVYQGSSSHNACQFSFACDGRSDLPQDGQAWEAAVAIAKLALANNRPLQIVATATYYHADNVDPKWCRSLHRLTKIGRHVFYSQRPAAT